MQSASKECLNCTTPFTPKNPKGKFCSDKCKVAFSRKKKGEKTSPAPVIAVKKEQVKTQVEEAPKVVVQDLNKDTHLVRPLTEKPPTTNFTVDTSKQNNNKPNLRSILQGLGYTAATQRKEYKPIVK